jgi:hypothetical protein
VPSERGSSSPTRAAREGRNFEKAVDRATGGGEIVGHLQQVGCSVAKLARKAASGLCGAASQVLCQSERTRHRSVFVAAFMTDSLRER